MLSIMIELMKLKKGKWLRLYRMSKSSSEEIFANKKRRTKLKGNIKEYKHIIWDFNGTILNDVWLTLEIINKMLVKYGMKKLTIEKYKNIFGFPIKDYYLKAGFDFSKTPFEELTKEFVYEYNARSLNECILHVGVKKTLKKFKNLNIIQSILSASFEEHLKIWSRV